MQSTVKGVLNMKALRSTQGS